MFGVNSENSDASHEFATNVGEVVQETVKSWNGLNERSLASLIADNLEIKRSKAAIVAEHVFVTELKDVYLFLPHMLDNDGFARYIVPCQLTVDLPLPDPLQLQTFVSFIRKIIDDERYTILSVLNFSDKIRIYLFNHSHSKCNTRYGAF
ncbi:hypothetical protein GCK32_016616 [Trichostrongylus colubriformis]|uniref:Uncharacterized protein n=1 Tax=Trichostrongylus colubriformis TaxID=6319 RepID=A0AAN8F4I6_TRICO